MMSFDVHGFNRVIYTFKTSRILSLSISALTIRENENYVRSALSNVENG